MQKSVRPYVYGRKSVAVALVLWFALSVLIGMATHPTLTFITLFAGAIVVIAAPGILTNSGSLARAVAKFTARTMTSLCLASAALFFFGALCSTAMFYLSNSPLPDFLLGWRRDITLNLEASLLTMIAFTNGLAGIALRTTDFRPLSNNRQGSNRLVKLGTTLMWFATRYTNINQKLFAIAIVPALALWFWHDAQRYLEIFLSEFTAPAFAVILFSVILATICNAATWLYVLPARLIVMSRLIWRLAHR